VISRRCRLAHMGWRLWDGWVAIFCIAIALSACDGIYLLSLRGWDEAGLVAHAFAVELSAVFIGLMPIAVVGGSLLVAAGRSGDRQASAALRRWVLGGSKDQRRARAASLFAAAVLFGLGLGGGAVASFELDRRIVQPQFHAVAVALAFGAIALTLGGLYPLVRRACSRLFAAAAPLPIIGWPMRTRTSSGIVQTHSLPADGVTARPPAAPDTSALDVAASGASLTGSACFQCRSHGGGDEGRGVSNWTPASCTRASFASSLIGTA